MKRWQVYAKKSIISVWTEYLRATAGIVGWGDCVLESLFDFLNNMWVIRIIFHSLDIIGGLMF